MKEIKQNRENEEIKTLFENLVNYERDKTYYIARSEEE